MSTMIQTASDVNVNTPGCAKCGTAIDRDGFCTNERCEHLDRVQPGTGAIPDDADEWTPFDDSIWELGPGADDSAWWAQETESSDHRPSWSEYWDQQFEHVGLVDASLWISLEQNRYKMLGNDLGDLVAEALEDLARRFRLLGARTPLDFRERESDALASMKKD
jgi:hypothetical protein